MSINYILIGARKVISLDKNVDLIQFQPWNENLKRFERCWKIYIQKPNGENELYTLPNGDELNETKAAACAKVILSHLNGESKATPKPAIAIGDRRVDFTDLSPKELSKLNKAGMKFPVRVERKELYSKEAIRAAIVKLDMSIMHDLSDPIDIANRQKEIAEIAEHEPHLIYAFLFKFLMNIPPNCDFDSVYLTILKKLTTEFRHYPDRPPLSRLITDCREAANKGQVFVTVDNVVHLALIYSGFELEVIQSLKAQGYLMDRRWHGLLPKELAASLGASPEALVALGASEEEMVDLVCHSLSPANPRSLMDDFFQFCIGSLPSKLSLVPLKQKVLKDFSTLEWNLSRFERVMEKQNHQVLENRPYLIATICQSPFIRSGDKIKMLKCLIDKFDQKTDLSKYFNHRLSDGTTPLKGAIISGGEEDLIRFLMAHGAAIEKTLVPAAVQAANVGALRVLVEKGIEDAERKTAFDIAISELPINLGGSYSETIRGLFIDLITFLLENDFPYHATPENDKIIVEFLLRTVQTKDLAVKFFTRYPFPLNVLTQHPNCGLHPGLLAALVPLAKARGEDLSALTVLQGNRMPILHYAVNEHYMSLVEQLLEAGVSVEERYKGMTPRVFAKQNIRGPFRYQSEAILQMIEKKLKGKSGDERTSFHEAAANGDIEGCKEWIAKGGYLPVDIHGFTPLHEAVVHGHLALVRVFFEALKTEIELGWDHQIEFPALAEDHLLTHALVQGDEALAECVWENREWTLHPEVRGRLQADTDKLLANDVLSYIALHHDFKVFQRAFNWLCRKDSIKKSIQEKALTLAVEKRSVEMAAWICSFNRIFERDVAAKAVETAVENQDLPMLRLLSSHGLLMRIPLYRSMEKICARDDAEMFSIFFDSLEYQVSSAIVICLPDILSAPAHNILKALIAKSASISAPGVQQIMHSMKIVFGDLKKMPPFLFFYLLKHAKSSEDWEKYLKIVKQIYDSYPKDVEKLIKPEDFLKEVFEEVLGKFQRKLAREDGIVQRLFALLQQVKTKNQLALYFNALQRGCSFDDLSVALEIAHERETADRVPSAEEFKALPKAKKIQWMTYFSVSGYRGGFNHSWQTINEEKDPELLYHGLKCLESIGVTIPLKKVKSRIAHFFEHSDENVRIQALRTLAAVIPNPKCDYCRAVLMEQLHKEGNTKRTELALLELLGYYETTSKRVVEKVLQLSHSEDREVRVQAAFALSRMYDEEALRRASAIVKSHDWDFMDEFFGDDRKFFPGAWWMFVFRPEFQDSRSAMLRRINDSFAFLHRERIAGKVGERMAAFEKDPSQFPDLVKLSDEIDNVPANCRYVPISYYYPTAPGNYLMRGLKSRKGDALFAESVRDLLRKGCGNSDLTRFEGEFTCASWSKIGHMFATHDAVYVKSYFTEAQGCLILVDPAYYNDQYRKGFARTEHEVAVNNVFYRGIPKNAIKLVYISGSFKNDIELLNSDRAIDEKFRSRLTSDAFKDCSIEELSQFRTYLHEEIDPLLSFHNRTHYRRFYDVFRFIDEEDIGSGIEERLKKDGVKAILNDDLKKETIRSAIARDVIAEEVGRDLFLSQDEMLFSHTDEEFKQKLPEMFTLLHLDKLPFKTTKARHGTDGNGARVSAYDHTVEVIAGNYGGFGLRTDPHSRRFLRLAALYHYVGHLPREGEVQGHLVERSAKIAKEEMRKQMKLQGISSTDADFISMLILHHEHFGDFLRGKIQLEELEKRISDAYQKLPKEAAVSKADFIKMLWALFTARASTLKKVQSQRQHYEAFLDSRNLDCTNLHWVQTLRDRINGSVSESPTPVASTASALWELDDAAFKQQVAQLVGRNAFPYDFRGLAASRAGHGHKADGSPVNLLEHTLDVICGNFGGFGLKTELTIAGMSPAQVRKVLRIAALFHDAGKIHGRKGHIERSAEIAVEGLRKEGWNVSEQEIQLIKQLILSNDLYGQFMMGRIDHRQLLAAFNKAYASQPLPVSEADFHKLMFALWIADASTLKVINREKGHHYRPIYQDLDTLDYDVLGRIYTLKYDILEEEEDRQI